MRLHQIFLYLYLWLRQRILPVVNAGNDINECNQPISVTLSGSPVGGTWSGSGITLGGVYTPNGVGTTNLVYSYTDPSTSCTNTDTLLAIVVAPPVITAGNDVSVCEDTASVTMVANQSGGTWSGNGIDATSGLYAVSNVGNYTFTYTYGFEFPNGERQWGRYRHHSPNIHHRQSTRSS